jgi:hypothetical protein
LASSQQPAWHGLARAHGEKAAHYTVAKYDAMASQTEQVRLQNLGVFKTLGLASSAWIATRPKRFASTSSTQHKQ